MSVTSLITFRVAPGRSADFERAFARTGMLERPRAVDGFDGAVLHRGVDDPDTYVVIGRWATVDAYREWQRRSIEDAVGLDELLETLVDPRPGQLFRALGEPGRGDDGAEPAP